MTAAHATPSATGAHRATAAAAAPSPLLELRGVTACYGRIQVLHGVDLVVPRGEVVALLGPNGAGIRWARAACTWPGAT